MTKYIDDNFLISNKTGLNLYLNYSKNMPIFDYHCHLSPKEIFENKKYKNITEIWLGGDHYKWRAMRINGIEEKYITGDGDDFEKFLAFAKTLEQAIGNPLFQWSHLELSTYFGIDEILNEKTAQDIWDRANKKLESITARTLIEDSKVTHICTTDDPLDDLKYHIELKKDESFSTKVLPTFRPDSAFKIYKYGFKDYIKKLEKLTGIEISSGEKLIAALRKRAEFFHEMGGRLADHGFEDFVFTVPKIEVVDKALKDALEDKEVEENSSRHFQSYLIIELAKIYVELGWTMQMHVGALRNTNTKMFEKIGADVGFDSMGDFSFAEEIKDYFDYLNNNEILPRTIVYNLNAKDNDVFSSLMGNFPKSGVPQWVTHGTAWWFYDQKFGIEDQMRSFANLGLLGRFLGMVTDSRSFLSFTRHDYFRRVVCNIIGKWAEENLIPRDMELLGNLVEGISYNNAKNYFEF